jgi:subtilisin family serine protease
MMNHARLTVLVAAIFLTAACGGGVTGLPQPSPAPSPSAGPVPINSAPAGQYEPGQILVKYRAGATARALSGTRTAQSVTATGVGGGFTFVVVQVPEGREAEYIAEYSRQPGVEYAELNLRYFLIDAERVTVASPAPSTGQRTEPLPAITPTDPKLSEFHSTFQVARLDGTMTPAAQATWQWDMHRINTASAWASVNGTGVKVAITDTGIDCTHPQLAGRCLAGYDTNSNVVIPAGANSDNAGHGTHVSGTVAAVVDGSDMVGIAPGAQLIPIAMFFPSPVGFSSTTVQGILKAVELGCDVFNASWGSSVPGRASFDAIDHAVKNNCVPVFSSGNSFTPSNRISYPAGWAATHPGIIAVASSTPTDRVSTFSSSGNYVTVAAPGEPIYSLFPMPQGANGFIRGTSMAAPHVTGVVALLLEKNPNLTPAQVKTILQNTARKPCAAYAKPDYGGSQCGTYAPGPGAYGWGILDAGAAVVATP